MICICVQYALSGERMLLAIVEEVVERCYVPVIDLAVAVNVAVKGSVYHRRSSCH